VATIIERERGLKDASARLGRSETALTAAHYVERAQHAPDSSAVLEVLGESSRRAGL
jgi:hypothetical protein